MTRSPPLLPVSRISSRSRSPMPGRSTVSRNSVTFGDDGGPLRTAVADAVPRTEKLRRLNEMIRQQRAWSAARNRRYAGQKLPVIIEHVDQKGAIARTAFGKSVRLSRVTSTVRSYATVKITDVRASSFVGEEVEQ